MKKFIKTIKIASLIIILTAISGCKVTKPETKKPIVKESKYEYFEKNNTIYYGDIKLDQVDADSFLLTKDDKFIKDKNKVYYWRSKKELISIEGIKPNAFDPLNEVFIKDSDSVFYRTFQWTTGPDMNMRTGPYFFEIISEADAGTFKVIRDQYAKDKNYAYELDANEIIKTKNIADLETFTYVDNSIGKKCYFKDKKNIYYAFGFEIVKDADPNTFIELPYCDGKDKNYFFRQGKRQ